MPTNVKIIIKDHILDAELFHTQCAKAVAGILPIGIAFPMTVTNKEIHKKASGPIDNSLLFTFPFYVC